MRTCFVSLACLAILVAACDEAVAPPTIGAVRVSVATTGGDPDLDGYELSVDGAARGAVAANGTVLIPDLSSGEHAVALGGLAVNCAADTTGGTNPRLVTVTGGDTTVVPFTVRCVATGVQIAAPTSGADRDPDGYTVSIDGAPPVPVSTGGVVTITRLSAGSHTVALAGVADNCAVADPNPRSVTLDIGEVAPVTFAVSCVALTGTLVVSTSTSGDALDADGYTVFVGDCYWDCISRPLGVNDIETIPSLPTGTHYVWLDGVAQNCHVTDGPETVTIAPADTARVRFVVSCSQTGSLQLAVPTAGNDPDSSYRVRVNGTAFDTAAQVTPNVGVTLSEVPAGDYSVTLDDIAPNCEVSGANPTAVRVPSGGTAGVTFDVACTSFGSVQLTVRTTGVDLDPDGYRFRLSRAGTPPFSKSGTIATNESITITGMPGDDYSVTLDGLAQNCDPVGPNPLMATVPSGGTATIAFDVICAQPRELAVTVLASNGGTDIYLVNSNGTGLTPLVANASQPAWSPDGSRLALVSTRDGNAEIYVISGSGSGLTRLTSGGAADADPAWSPDGSRIAFTSDRDGNAEIYVMNADGTNSVRLTDHRAADRDPAWSPDGSQIAFTSDRDGNVEIYVMNADGSGATRLTFDAADDRDPAWSADGSRLVFSRASWCVQSFCELFVVNADGTGETRVATDAWSYAEYGSSALGPAWSPAGNWIAFGATHFICPWDCDVDYTAVEAVRPDGSRVEEILRNAAEPAWRP